MVRDMCGIEKYKLCTLRLVKSYWVKSAQKLSVKFNMVIEAQFMGWTMPFYIISKKEGIL